MERDKSVNSYTELTVKGVEIEGYILNGRINVVSASSRVRGQKMYDFLRSEPIGIRETFQDSGYGVIRERDQSIRRKLSLSRTASQELESWGTRTCANGNSACELDEITSGDIVVG